MLVDTGNRTRATLTKSTYNNHYTTQMMYVYAEISTIALGLIKD